MVKLISLVTASLLVASLAAPVSYGAVLHRKTVTPPSVVGLNKSKANAPAAAQRLEFKRSGNAKALNPQPLPPGPAGEMRTSGQIKALNPQPLPPGPAGQIRASGQAKALNPQPLPPGPDKSAAARAGTASKLSVNAKRMQSLQAVQQQKMGGAVNR